MMFAWVDEDGMVVGSVYGEVEHELILPPRPGLSLISCAHSFEPGQCYFKDGLIKPLPAAPNPVFTFDVSAEEWVDLRTVDDFYDEAQALVRAFRDQVNARRLQVITAGTDINVTGYGIVALQGRPEDQMSLLGLMNGAQLRISMGDSFTPMTFLDRENVLHYLTPMQMIDLWRQGAEFISAVYARSWQVKEMDPVTTDPSNWTL